jgi:uncharacterized OB-fold protein
MQTASRSDSKRISIEQRNLEAAECEKCGAKMYPGSLLKPHLTRHRRKKRWFMTELRKLQHTMSRMRDFA